MRYASQTTVTADRSRGEIEKTLQRYGATGFMYGWEGQAATVAFKFRDRLIRIMLQMPDQEGEEYTTTPTRGRRRNPEQAYQLWEKAGRQRWRALLLVIKAKLEAVESGIATFDNEFLAYTVLPDGRTISEHVGEILPQILSTGKMRPLLPAPGDS
jgi:hypothetical protein